MTDKSIYDTVFYAMPLNEWLTITEVAELSGVPRETVDGALYLMETCEAGVRDGSGKDGLIRYMRFRKKRGVVSTDPREVIPLNDAD